MYDYRVVLGILATGIGLVSYVPYFRDILNGTTKPHPFSWFVWGLLTGVATAAQLAAGGGAGAWATGITCLACTAIGVFGLFKGEKVFAVLDWVALAGAIVGIILWSITSDPVYAVVLVTAADALGFVPTFRKSFGKPFEETLVTYSLSLPKWFLGIVALRTFNFTTVFFPAAILAMNIAFVFMVLIRRRQLGKVGRTI